jgi:hypothetical protein
MKKTMMFVSAMMGAAVYRRVMSWLLPRIGKP